ncbi:unnamed protein product [Schistosoma curassoni]|uniref:C2H2-type domain-containing protein n=1 Tax=Schistosoma curassoni TaxID=6186 RepID=A0A183L1C5_9TREM|nr:unnamed protein product [Schistosoma curassoni]
MLNNHVKAIHKGIKLTCKQCDRKFNCKSNLNLHVKSAHEGNSYWLVIIIFYHEIVFYAQFHQILIIHITLKSLFMFLGLLIIWQLILIIFHWKLCFTKDK